MHHTGRVLCAGFDPAKAVFDRAAAPEALDIVFEPDPAAAAAAANQALAAGKPFQLVLLRAARSGEALITATVRRLQAVDATLPVLLAGLATDAAMLRALAATLGERVFFVTRPLRHSAFAFIDVLLEKRQLDRTLAEMREGAEVTHRAYSLVDAEFRRQNARLLKQEKEMALQSSLLEATLDSMRQGLLVLNDEFKVTVFNGCLAELIGFSPDILHVGASAHDLVAAAAALGHYPGRDIEAVYTAWHAQLMRREALSHRQRLADGRELAVDYEPMADGGWVITYDDITDQIRAEAALEEQNHLFEVALGNMAHGLCMFDEGKRLILCNASYGRMYGLPAELMRQGTPLQAILDFRASAGNAPADMSTYFDVVALAKRKKATANRRIPLQDGRTIQISHNPMKSGGYVATHEDITSSIQADATIAHMAHHDALTGLPNRVLLRQKVEEALARVQRGAKLTMLCLDLDLFKSINDTLGPSVGDLLLKAVAGRLLDCVRQSDTVARVGGDEFVILQNQIETPQQADSLARRLIEAIREPFELDGHQVVVNASVGIAIAPNDGADADKLLKNADTALYRAKAEGRGLYRFFEPAMDARLQQRRMLEFDLRKAVAAGDFQLHYQPIVDAKSEKVIGVEALLRWKHAERGMVSPADFIPVAEATGLIIPLGEWVIRRACTDAATWPRDIKVAVNLSPVQFSSQTLVHTVVSALGESGLSPRRLEIEITESVLLSESEATLTTLHHLRDLGVRIALDDFGTGYSSLSYLRSFPFDKIKIDRSFVKELSSRDDCMAIIKAVAGLGANLGMATTAEGVETAEQLRLVREQGCTEIQGYYFSAAKPMADITLMLGGGGTVAAVA